MKTSILFAALLMCICFKLYAQQPIDQLIATEQKFAATSKAQTTKIAFLYFLDSNCVGYHKGVQTVMFKDWTERKESNSKLTWNPELAIIGSSGELGVTTGPWEFRQNSLKDTPVTHGYFATVWKKQNDGRWKAMFDMGIGYNDASVVNSDEVKVESIVLNNVSQSSYDGNWLMIDQQLSNKKTTLISLLAPDAWVSIQGHAPFKNANAAKAVADILPNNIQYKPAGYFVAQSNDLLAVYGGVLKDGKQEQAFLRVWIKKENEWKLMMMMIS